MLRHTAAAMLCLLPCALSADAHPPVFVPVEMPEQVYGGGWEHFVGGGVAVFDCTGDGLPELYAAGGENPAALFRNDSDAALGFTPITPEALALTGVTGAYPLDIDSDGIMDLAILRVGPDLLMQGQGDCQFAPFTDLGFTSGDHWSTAFSATWEAGQSLPTLAFGTYVDRSDPEGPFEACDATQIYRPEGDRYGAPLALEPGFCALSILFSDWSRTAAPICASAMTATIMCAAGRNRCGRWRTPRAFMTTATTAALFHLGHGYRVARCDRRRLPRDIPHLDGRPEIPAV